MSEDAQTPDLEGGFLCAAQTLLGDDGGELTPGQKRHLLAALESIKREQSNRGEQPGFRGHLDLLKPYIAGKSVVSVRAEYGVEQVIKLSSNEHAEGASPSAVEVIRDVLDCTHRYPEVHPEDLLVALADHHGVQRNQIFLGCGSNEVFDTVVRVLRPLGPHAVFSASSFSMYRHVMHVYGVPCTEVPITNRGQDLDALAAAVSEKDASFVFLNTPHNPTGQIVSEEEIKVFMERVGSKPYVLLDEAYIEFALDMDGVVSGPTLLSQYPNMIVCRTFSKAYGLAGLRVGYALARPEIIDLLNRVRQPFNLTRFAAPAALAALQDQKWVEKTVADNRKGMETLVRFFKGLGIMAQPSGGNFLMIELGVSSAPLCEKMLRRGIILRSLESYGLPHAIRMTVGTAEQIKVFMETFVSLWSEK